MQLWFVGYWSLFKFKFDSIKFQDWGAMAPSQPPSTHPSPRHFFSEQKEKGKQKEKKKEFQTRNYQKGCHQVQNVTVLPILEPLKFKNLCCQLTMVAVADNTFQCFLIPPLCHQFRWAWLNVCYFLKCRTFWVFQK